MLSDLISNVLACHVKASAAWLRTCAQAESLVICVMVQEQQQMLLHCLRDWRCSLNSIQVCTDRVHCIVMICASSTTIKVTLASGARHNCQHFCYIGQLTRAAVELAKLWRTDKYLRKLDVSLTTSACFATQTGRALSTVTIVCRLSW